MYDVYYIITGRCILLIHRGPPIHFIQPTILEYNYNIYSRVKPASMAEIPPPCLGVTGPVVRNFIWGGGAAAAAPATAAETPAAADQERKR